MEEKILEIMKEVFEVQDIDTNVSQANCEKWDSLHQLNLISELDDAFDVEFEPEEIAEMKTFEKVVEYLKAKQ